MKIIGQLTRVQRREEFMRFILTKMGLKAEKLSRKIRKSLMERFTMKSKRSTNFQMVKRKFGRLWSKEIKRRRKFIIWKEERMFLKKSKARNL